MNWKSILRDNWSIALYVLAFLLKSVVADWVAILVLAVAIAIDIATTERGKNVLREKLLNAEAFMCMGASGILDVAASGVDKAEGLLDRIGKRLEKEADDIRE